MYNPDMTLSDHQPPWHIGEEQVGQRVDRFITSVLDNMSRNVVQQLIVNGEILVNERASKPGYILRIGYEVQLLQDTAKSRTNSAKPRSMPLEVVHEDEDLLVINKAAGMVVHPAPGHADDTLVNALLARYPGLQGVEGLRPGIVHRLPRTGEHRRSYWS